MSRTRKPLIAGVLNVVLPGLGLLYIGHKKGALVNFALVNTALVIFTVFFADPTIIEHVHWLFLGLAEGFIHNYQQRWRQPIKQFVSDFDSHIGQVRDRKSGIRWYALT